MYQYFKCTLKQYTIPGKMCNMCPTKLHLSFLTLNIKISYLIYKLIKGLILRSFRWLLKLKVCIHLTSVKKSCLMSCWWQILNHSIKCNKINYCDKIIRLCFSICRLLERSTLEDIILKPLQMLDEANHSPAMHSSLPAVSLSLTIVNDCNIQVSTVYFVISVVF